MDDNKPKQQDVAASKLNELTKRGNQIPVNSRRGNQVANNLKNNIRPNKSLGNPENHQRPNLGVPTKENKEKPNPSSKLPSNNKKSGDVGSRNLQNSLANRARNLINMRKKKKNNNQTDSTGDNTDTTSNDNNDDSASSLMDDMLAKSKRRFKIKVIIYTSIAVFAILFILVILMAIFGIDITTTIPAINQGSYGTDKFSPTYEEGTKEYKDEIKYYEKLKDVREESIEKNGEELKTSYIHAILVYIYYQIDDISEIDTSNNTIPINYGKMAEKIDAIVELMQPADNSKTIDYEKNGEFYNKLKESSEFKDYYKDILKEKSITDLLDEIFDLASELDEIENDDEAVITSETVVDVSTDKEETGTKKVSVSEYLVDSIYANNVSISNSEAIKAYTVAYSTNIVAKNKNLTIDSNIASMSNEICSVKEGCSYDSKNNLVSGGGERNNQNTIYYNGEYYYKQPLTSSEIDKINKSVNSVFGNVLVKSDGTYPELDLSKLTGLGDGKYEDILKNSYGDYKIKNIGEGSYILDASYGDKKVLVDVVMYDQSEYTSSFCGLKKETIASSGCGVTSMAMVMSTYENNNKYTPLWTNEQARKNKQCGAGRGTDYGHFTSVSTSLGYSKPTIYYKNKANGWKISKSSYNNVLKNLSQGNLVIINVTKGHFTGGEHYMVLGGIDPSTKKVYVYDPNNKSNTKNRKTGNGWYSFNDIIVPETKAFIIIKKKG